MIKLDIGCGGRGSMYPEFLGIDIHPVPPVRRTSAPYLRHDFIKDPLQDEWIDSASEIVAFHIIEHLPYDEGTELLRRILRCLAVGAKAYISCPDLRLFCQKYLDGELRFYARKTKGRLVWKGDTLADKLNYQIHQNGHLWAYDLESLTLQARQAGAGSVAPLPKDHFWCRRPDHETGIIITR